MGTNEFSLVYEGLKDESLTSVHRFKLALIADLELDVEHAQALLQGSSKTVLSGESRERLEHAREVLEGVGAKVAIVTMTGSDTHAADVVADATSEVPTAEAVAAAESDAGAEDLEEDEVEEEDDEEVVTLDLDESLLGPAKPRPVQEYSLSMEEEEELEKAMKMMHSVVPQRNEPEEDHDSILGPPPTELLHSLGDAPEEPHHDSDLSLGPEPDVMPHKESSAAEADLRFDDLALDPPHEKVAAARPAEKPQEKKAPEILDTGLVLVEEEPVKPEPKAAPLPPPQAATPSPPPVSNVQMSPPPPDSPVKDSTTSAQAPAEPNHLVKAMEAASGEAAVADKTTDFSRTSRAPLASLMAPGRGESKGATGQDPGFTKPQLVAMFGVGLMTLVGANWLIFAPNGKSSAPLAALSAEEEQPKEAVKPKPAPLPVFAGSIMAGELSVTVTTTINRDGSIIAKVSGATGERPPLRPEQLAGVVETPPWLSRFDTDSWLLQEMGANEWTGNTVGYFYIEYKNHRFRLPGVVRIRVLQPAGELTRTAEVEVLLSPPNDPALPAPGNLIEAVKDDVFRIYSRATVTLASPQNMPQPGVQSAPKAEKK